jgi:hypothetical protein
MKGPCGALIGDLAARLLTVATTPQFPHRMSLTASDIIVLKIAKLQGMPDWGIRLGV